MSPLRCVRCVRMAFLSHRIRDFRYLHFVHLLLKLQAFFTILLCKTLIFIYLFIQRLKGDLESITEKADRLDREMIDVTLAGSMSGGNEVMSLKKAKNDLDAKCKDQEEELDEQAGQIQQLEQVDIFR